MDSCPGTPRHVMNFRDSTPSVSGLAVPGGDTAAVLEALDAPLRAQAELLLAWGADLPETPTASLAAEAAGCLRTLRLLNHHREIALIGARLQDLEDAGARAGVVEELGRVSALAAAIRRLEREGGPAPTTNWAAALRAEAGAGVPPTAGPRST
jgi:hypothetical protein